MKIAHIGMLSVVALVASVVAWNAPSLTPRHASSDAAVQLLSFSNAMDLTDDRALVGASHNVFVGKVSRLVSSKVYQGYPETHFMVDVQETIKGSLHGEVEVVQMGGMRDGILYLAEGDSVSTQGSERGLPLLRVGETYLLGTRQNEEYGWQTLIPDQRVQAAMQRGDSRIAEYRKSYQSEIIPEADRASGKAYNQYAK